MDLEHGWWEHLDLDGGILDLEGVEVVPTSWDIISSMGYLPFSIQDVSLCIWGPWVDLIGVIK